MSDLFGAAIDQMQRAYTERIRGRERTRFSRHKLLRAFSVDCEHAALLRRKGMDRKADQLIEGGRDRTYHQLRMRHGFAATAKKSHLIDRVLTRVEVRMARAVERDWP